MNYYVLVYHLKDGSDYIESEGNLFTVFYSIMFLAKYKASFPDLEKIQLFSLVAECKL